MTESAFRFQTGSVCPWKCINLILYVVQSVSLCLFLHCCHVSVVVNRLVFFNLTLKASITTTSNDIHKYFIIVHQRK